MPNTRLSQNIPHNITPAEALQLLKDGNTRFVNNLKINRNLLSQMNETKDGQWPFAVVLSCMDSRTSVELIFDQGLGDVFSVRIAGNIISEFVLGSIEYAIAAAGAKLIVVLGHTGCGAVKGACDTVANGEGEGGHLDKLLHKIHPAVEMEKSFTENRDSSNIDFVNTVADINVQNSVMEILSRSKVARKMVSEGSVDIVPAMYNVGTGEVNFSKVYSAQETLA